MKVLLLSSTLLSGGLASSATTTAGSITSTSSIDEQIRRSLTKKALVLDELPNSNGGQWQTLPNGVEYQPAPDLSPLAQEHLRRLTTSDTTSRDAEAFQKMFVDGAETYYDEYSQAWRALGFYIDCDADQMLQDGDEPRRKLPGEDEDQGPCYRYLLWAAYVDEGYSGHGIGEYQYYDRKSKQWSDYACQKYGNTDRCVKMDCHSPDTHFSLLGFFKEPYYDTWMEQLFKHEGDCVWTDYEYQFMQADRKIWPSYCTESGVDDLYFDLKPGAYGEYNIALYTDDSCIQEYTQESPSVAEVLMKYACEHRNENQGGDRKLQQNNNKNNKYYYTYDLMDYSFCDGGGGEEDRNRWWNNHYQQAKGNVYQLEEDLKKWNDAFDVFKQCQPCKAYNLTHIVAGLGYVANADGNRYGDKNNGGRRKLADDDATDDQYYSEFRCYDVAGYTNVNQCMKFQTKTTMMTASVQDVIMAANQGTITSVTIHGKNITGTKSHGGFNAQSIKQSFQSTKMGKNIDERDSLRYGYIAFGVSAGLFLSSFVRFLFVLNKFAKKEETRYNERFLMPSATNARSIVLVA